jgi:hypothetical protein
MAHSRNNCLMELNFSGKWDPCQKPSCSNQPWDIVLRVSCNIGAYEMGVFTTFLASIWPTREKSQILAMSWLNVCNGNVMMSNILYLLWFAFKTKLERSVDFYENSWDHKRFLNLGMVMCVPCKSIRYRYETYYTFGIITKESRFWKNNKNKVSSNSQN